MAVKDCIFCKIVEGEIPSQRVYEDDNILAFLDINPVNPGHCLVIPKRHYNGLGAVPDGLAGEVMVVAKRIGAVMAESVGAGGFNLGLNNGLVAGQAVGHVHMHVMPRFKDDGLKLWPGKQIAQKELESIGNKIRKAVEKG